MRYKRVYNYEIYEFTIQQVSTIHRASSAWRLFKNSFPALNPWNLNITI